MLPWPLDCSKNVCVVNEGTNPERDANNDDTVNRGVGKKKRNM